MPLDKNFNKRKLDAVIVKNEGIPFQLEAINEVRINKSAVEKRCASATNRRTVKKHNQVAWLLKAITCMDLTTLSGDDTESRVVRLCNKAKTPLRNDLLKKLGIEDLNIKNMVIKKFLKLSNAAGNMISQDAAVISLRTGG